MYHIVLSYITLIAIVLTSIVLLIMLLRVNKYTSTTKSYVLDTDLFAEKVVDVAKKICEDPNVYMSDNPETTKRILTEKILDYFAENGENLDECTLNFIDRLSQNDLYDYILTTIEENYNTIEQIMIPIRNKMLSVVDIAPDYMQDKKYTYNNSKISIIKDINNFYTEDNDSNTYNV